MLSRITATVIVLVGTTACATHVASYSGSVQTESVGVGSEIGGRVAEVDVAVGATVRRGSIVLRLDPGLLSAQYDQARAQVRQASARLVELEHGNLPTDVARAREQSVQAAVQYHQVVAQSGPQAADLSATIGEAQANLNLAQTTLVRTQSLVATGDLSQATLDQARASYAQAQARLAQARASYANIAGAQLAGERESARANARAQAANYQTVRAGTRSEDIAAAGAALAAAEATAAYGRKRLDEAVVTSPTAGLIASFNLHPGDLLGANQQAAIIDTFAEPYTYIYASQRDLSSLAAGTHLRVRSDAGGVIYEGVVEAFDRTAQFTPQNVETADERADLVYGVKVRIRDPKHRLLSGTTVTVVQQ